MKKKWGFVTCGPNQVLVVSGCCHSKPSISVGGRVFVCPLIHKLQILTLNVLTVTLETINTHSHHGIPVTVRGTAQVKIESTKESLRKACELFLGMMDCELVSFFRDIIEGHQRDMIGKMDIQDIYYRQDVFCNKLVENCSSKLQEMGLVLLSYNVNQVEDTSGCMKDYMKQLAANNVKNVRIMEAESRRDSIIETILSESELELVQTSLEMKIMEEEKKLMAQKLENEVESSKLEAVKEMTSLLEEVRNVGKVKMAHLEGDELRSELLLEEEEMNLVKERSSLCRQIMQLDSQEQSLDRMSRAHLKMIKDSTETEAGIIQTLAETHSQILALASSTEHDLMKKMMTTTHLLRKKREGEKDEEEREEEEENLLLENSSLQITDTSTLINTNGKPCSNFSQPLNKETSFLSDIQPSITQETMTFPENVMVTIAQKDQNVCNGTTTSISGQNPHQSNNKKDEVVAKEGENLDEKEGENLDEKETNLDEKGESFGRMMDENEGKELAEMLSEMHLMQVSQLIGLNLSNVIFAAVFEEVLELFLK